MLKLQNIHVQLSRRVFTATSRKMLRISVGNVVKTTSQAAKFINQQYIEWSQQLNFPLLYNKQFLFQIYEQHQFGYNPEQIQNILKGKFTIDNIADIKGTWEIYNNKQEKIGFLSADIVSKVPSMMKSLLKETILKENKKATLQEKNIQTIPEVTNAKVLKIRSLVSRTPTLTLKKAYISIEIGSQAIKTPEIRSRAGQLVSIQTKQISIEPNQTEAKIKIYSVKDQGQSTVVAEGIFHLIGTKPPKKVILTKDGNEVGEIYVQSQIIDPSQPRNESFISNSSRAKVGYANQLLVAQSANQSKMNPRTKSISPERQIDFTRLEDFGIKSSRFQQQGQLNSSMISTNSSRIKKSVVHQNANVAFSKQKRFMLYQDRQNERVTYLNDRSFQFKNRNSGNRYYRGASFGYGEKTDFARQKRTNPGVGNYKLPSIWDRY